MSMINKKRSRSQSGESTSSKIRKIDSRDLLLSKATGVDSSSKILCHFCTRDISKSIRIICDECIDREYCIDCLVLCKEENGQPHKHDYHIVDKLDFPIFTSDWTSSEELTLLSSNILNLNYLDIEKFGLDNWTDISEYMGTKAKLQCEAHYYNFYYKNEKDFHPKETDCILSKGSIGYEKRKNQIEEKNNISDEIKIKAISQNAGKIPEFVTNKDHKNNRSRSLIKNRNRKDQTTITSASEILGYWPKREEFDIEFLNDAELEISELEFLDDDTKEEQEIKINVLRAYNAQLEEREKRRKFVIERNLLDIKKQMNFERKLSKDDREIYNCLKPFAQYMDNSQFHELFDGIVLEKNIRQRLNQLKQYKRLGIKTYDEIEKYLEVDTRNKKDDKKHQMIFDSCGLGSRISRFLRFGEDESNEIDSNEKEKNFVKNLNVSRSTYFDIKKRIIKELIAEKESKNNIGKVVMQNYDLDKETAEGILDFVISIQNNPNSL